MPVDHADPEAPVAARLDAGDLAAARALLVGAVRARPDDQRARMFLFQLLCVEGEWDKARTHLRALAGLSPEAQMLAAAYGATIEAEAVRATAMAGGARRPLPAGAPDWALAFVAADDAGARAAALDDCPDTPGEVDGRAFDFLYDGDGRFATTIEAVVAGKWGLIPFATIDEIVTDGPVDLHGMVWLPAEIRFREGPALAALLPVRYPGSERADDPALRLARRTEWREEAGETRGLGQRVWTTSAGEDVPILSFRRIRFGPAA